MSVDRLQDRLKKQEETRLKLKELGFEVVKSGVFVYKTFNGTYTAPEEWRIRAGSVITNDCDKDNRLECSFGINVAPLKWVERYYGSKGGDKNNIWKCFIPNEWLDGVCIWDNADMYQSKIRAEMVKLVKVLKWNDPRRVNMRKKWHI